MYDPLGHLHVIKWRVEDLSNLYLWPSNREHDATIIMQSCAVLWLYPEGTVSHTNFIFETFLWPLLWTIKKNQSKYILKIYYSFVHIIVPDCLGLRYLGTTQILLLKLFSPSKQNKKCYFMWIVFGHIFTRNAKNGSECLKLIWSGAFAICSTQPLWLWSRIGSRLKISH